MILPANLSSMMQHQLSYSMDEHVAPKYQHNHRNHAHPLNSLSAVRATPLLQRVIPENTVQPLVKNLHGNTTANDSTITSRRNLSLLSEPSFLGSQSNSLTKNSHRITIGEKDKEESDNNGEFSKLIDLFEMDMMRLTIDTAILIQKESIFNRFLVAAIYQSPVFHQREKNLINHRMIVVAPLDESLKADQSFDVSAHTTFLVNQKDNDSAIATLPAQLISGDYGYSNDWVSIKLMKDASMLNGFPQQATDALYRIHAYGFQKELMGNAVVWGDASIFSDHHADMSLHVPGVNKLWDGEKLPIINNLPLEQSCSPY